MKEAVLINAQLIYLAAVVMQLIMGSIFIPSFLRPDIFVAVVVILLIRCEARHMVWLGLFAGLWYALYLSGPGRLMIISFFLISMISAYIKDMAFFEHKLLPALLVSAIYAITKLGGIIAGYIWHKHVGSISAGILPTIICALLFNILMEGLLRRYGIDRKGGVCLEG
ncbi:MAG: hypothetical protein PHO05_02040 [bacterium]|nr:hypothetical protein [bacterium]